MQLIPMASLAKFWFLMFYCYFSFLFVSDVFMVLKNHHLQLEILTLRLSVVFLAKSMIKSTYFGSSLRVLVLHFLNFVIWYLN